MVVSRVGVGVVRWLHKMWSGVPVFRLSGKDCHIPNQPCFSFVRTSPPVIIVQHPLTLRSVNIYIYIYVCIYNIYVCIYNIYILRIYYMYS